MSRDWTREELNAASEMMKQNSHMGFEEFCQALAQNQPVSFELAERSRKELVKDISEILGEKAEYMRMPTCAYRVGGYTIAKDGTLTWEADDDAEVLLRALTARGWDYAIVIDTAVTEETQPEVKAEPDASAEENTCGEAEADTYGFCIELPDEALPDAARVNLDRLIESKGNLLRKALGTDTIVYKITDGKIRFLWFHISSSPEEVTAYTQLITALVEMAKNSKRITAKERTVENEKYAFRCFLLRLGFIGAEYKQTCKTLLKNFEGSSAFHTQEAADKYRAKQEGKKEDENRSEEDAACLE
ncbi:MULTISPECIES: virulence protein [unclassified Blautia]|uniref:virulence protein n=1 Tax=unclassified Blautia TaxID=2648079 RepID=UPI003F8B3BA2